MSRGKGKANPKGHCKICGYKIFNRYKNALHCLECSETKIKVTESLYQKLIALKRKYPKLLKYKIKIMVEVTKEEQY